jgi:hypothetical protein
MSFLITGGVRAGILYGDSLEARPEFFLDGLAVVVGPYSDQALRERQLMQTVGSTDWLAFDSVDDVRFDPASGVLSAVALRTAPREIQSKGSVRIPAAETGLIQLAEPQDFRLESASVRWKAPGCSALICLYGDTDSRIPSGRQIRIAEGLDLIVEEDRLAGWILHGPYRYLSVAGVTSGPAIEDRELEQALDWYLSIASHPTVDQLLDGDETLWRKLDDIAQLVSPGVGDSLRRSILSQQIEYLMEWR